MSVVSSGRTIFCEGKQTSLDTALLNRVVENIDRCTIIPVGSKFSFSTFAEGYFFPKQIRDQRYLVFRDRDFDVKPAPNIKLLQLRNANQSIVLTYRTCVENYLLDANLIEAYWTEKYQEKQENPSSKWGHGDSIGISAITAWIENSARDLQDYQAVRWALGDLLSTSAARKQLKTTWMGSSGILPESLELENCKNQALELINQFRQSVESITETHFQKSLDAYLQQFEQDDFWEQKQYLIWFQGKDIQKEMQRQQNQYISLSHFFNWAINKLDIDQHPDLIDLRERIRAL